VSLEDLVLFGDCYYLPHGEGPEGEALYRAACTVLDAYDQPAAAEAFRGPATRLRHFCGALTELRDRPLFHALSRRIWELREALDLLERFASARVGEAVVWPAIERRGLVARLHHLLIQRLPRAPDA
jgi:hypothetical protein